MCNRHSLVIDFGNLRGRRNLINNQVEFSEYVADKFLKKIPDRLEANDENRVEFELAVESFLFFIVRGRDHLLQKVNSTMALGLKPRKVNLEAVKAELQKCVSDTNATKILQLLDDSTQSPFCYCDGISQPDLDKRRNKAWLSELSELRNTIAHNSIISKHTDVQLPQGSATSSMTVKMCRNNRCQYRITEPSIRAYFQNSYDKFVNLHRDMIKILNI